MFKQFSPNTLKTFSQCPRKYYIKYVKNIIMPVNDDIFEFGKNIHAIASYYLRGENIDKIEKMLSPKEAEIWNYLKSIKYFGYEVINTEYNLSVKIGEIIFGGRLDALLKKDNYYYILDYKTGKIPQNAVYDYQTMIYLLAVSNFYKTDNIKFIYLDLKNRNEFQINYSKEIAIEYEERLIDIINKINNIDTFEKKQECECEYSIICY